MANLQTLLDSRWDRDVAYRKLSEMSPLRSDVPDGGVEIAFSALVPLIRKVRKRTLKGLSPEDYEEAESYCAQKLWTLLHTNHYPEDLATSSSMEAWWWTVLRNTMLKYLRSWKQNQPPEQVADVLVARRTLYTPRDSSAISSENSIFLSELPDVLWKRAAFDVTVVALSEAPALRYIIHALFSGQEPSISFLLDVLKVRPSRVNFLVDYSTLVVRKELRRMVDEFPEVLFAHPVSFIMAEDEEDANASEE